MSSDDGLLSGLPRLFELRRLSGEDERPARGCDSVESPAGTAVSLAFSLHDDNPGRE
jgi:hypothetical protein